jgi:hypothetical protein
MAFTDAGVKSYTVVDKSFKEVTYENSEVLEEFTSEDGTRFVRKRLWTKDGAKTKSTNRAYRIGKDEVEVLIDYDDFETQKNGKDSSHFSWESK